MGEGLLYDTGTNMQYIQSYVIKFNRYLWQVGNLAFTELNILDSSANKNRITMI